MDVCIPSEASDTLLSDGRIISTFRGRGKDPHFNWNPGFRIGAGYEFPCSNWNVGVIWSHYNSKAHRSLDYENNLKWNINLDIIDLVAAYQFDFNSCFSLRPYFGLRGVKINQKLRTGLAPDYAYFTSSSENLFYLENKNKFRGIGPLFGLEADFQVMNGFSLYVNGTISWLYGKNHANLNNSAATRNTLNFINIKNKTHSNLMVGDACFGIRW